MKKIICKKKDISVQVTTLSGQEVTLKQRSDFDMSAGCVNALIKFVQKLNEAQNKSHQKLAKVASGSMSDQEASEILDKDIDTDIDIYSLLLTKVYDKKREFFLKEMSIDGLKELWEQVQDEMRAFAKK